MKAKVRYILIGYNVTNKQRRVNRLRIKTASGPPITIDWCEGVVCIRTTHMFHCLGHPIETHVKI